MTTQQANAIREQIDPTYVVECISENFQPEEVFSEEQLSTWAEENGFTKDKEDEDK